MAVLGAQREANLPRNGRIEWDQRERNEVADDRDTQPWTGAHSLGTMHTATICDLMTLPDVVTIANNTAQLTATTHHNTMYRTHDNVQYKGLHTLV